MSIIFKGSNDQSLFPIPKTSYLERNYSKTFRKTGNTTSNRNNYKVPYLSNIFPDNEVEGGEQPRWTVKSNEFIQWLTDLRASLKHGLKIIRCLCKSCCSSGQCAWQKVFSSTYAFGPHQETEYGNIENTIEH